VKAWIQKRRMMQRYDLTVGLYDRLYSEEQEAKFKAALSEVQLNCSDFVLDAGCGTGLLFEHITDKPDAIVGLDISKKALLLGKDRAGKFGNVHFVQADVDYLPFKDRCFSVVFVFTVFQNLPSPQETLKEIKKTAKTDSLIVVTGLKKVFSATSFQELLQKSDLRIVAFNDTPTLKCFVAVCF